MTLQEMVDCLRLIEQNSLAQIYFEKGEATLSEQDLLSIRKIYQTLIPLVTSLPQKYEEKIKQLEDSLCRQGQAEILEALDDECLDDYEETLDDATTYLDDLRNSLSKIIYIISKLNGARKKLK